MRVLWHMPTLRTNTCGLSRRALRYAGALREAGHDVTFLVQADRTDAEARIKEFPVLRADVCHAAAPHWSLQALARRTTASRIVRGCAMAHDLFITCQPEAVLAQESCRSGVPCVFVCGGSTLLHDEAGAVRLLERRGGARRIWNIAAFTIDRWIKRDCERRAMQCADAVVFNSQTTLRQARQTYELDSPRLTAIVGGVDTVEFQPPTESQRAAARAAIGVPNDSFVVAWTGRMAAEKGVERLLEAIRSVDRLSVNVLLAGDGPQRPALEDWTRRTGLEGRVCFVGVLGDVRPVLHAADAFVFPSIGESFGNALAEAMACGLPCIGLRPDGHGVMNANIELLDNGRAGLLVDADSPGRLADAIRLVAVNEPLRAELGRAARDRAVAAFCWRAAEASFVRLAERVAHVVRVVRGADRNQVDHNSASAARASGYQDRLLPGTHSERDAAARERLQWRTT